MDLVFGFIIPLILPLFTDNSPCEEPPGTPEKEETEECDHEGESFTIKTEE